MPELVLADEIAELSLNLAPYGPSGVVPEPSTDQVDRWRMDLADIVEQSTVELPRNPTMLDQAAAAKEAASRNPELNELALDAYARLCGGRQVPNKSKAKGAPPMVWEGGFPTRDQLAALPSRGRNVVFGWLAEHLSPESSLVATRD